jgi:hypothetical protein
MYDLRTMEMKHEPVVREPGCPVCGHEAAASNAGGAPAG